MKKNDSENHDFRKKALSLSDLFFELEGRRPRVLVGTFQNNAGTVLNTIANSLSDTGFDVDISPFITSGQSVCMNALENDVDVLLMLIDSSEFKDHILELESSLSHHSADFLLLYICNNCRSRYLQKEESSDRIILELNEKRSEIGHLIMKLLLHETGS
ncbi:hypothetical protein LCM02_06940 [Lutimonas saemankumensis]|uniref:hypothetical protein n=1 Tax=Lutimonas saemankumensis TaxID=483016 RepID=UPI001CD34135|nr:hypothetical protein [Lutimonas saemankumensis]MCA0932181.1 hypothetical protein [Lutimonas saemankumensis]